MFKKVKTILSLLLVTMMVVSAVPMSALAEEDTQEITFGTGEIKGEIIEELDMSDFTIVILDENGNVVPMVMPMSTTTVQTWPDMTLGAGNTMIFYNNKNNGYISVPSGAELCLTGNTNKNFSYKIGFKEPSRSSFIYSPTHTFTPKDVMFGSAIGKVDICFALKNVSTYSVKLSNIRAMLCK